DGKAVRVVHAGRVPDVADVDRLVAPGEGAARPAARGHGRGRQHPGDGGRGGGAPPADDRGPRRTGTARPANRHYFQRRLTLPAAMRITYRTMRMKAKTRIPPMGLG